MKKFTAQLNGDGYISINADAMIMKDDTYICVYNGGNLVAFLDVSVVLSAHLSEKAVSECKN